MNEFQYRARFPKNGCCFYIYGRLLVVLAAFFFMAFMFAGCLGSARLNENYSNIGVYQGTGQGYRGPIRVLVTVSEGGHINDIEILEHNEDSFAVFALDELVELVLELNSTDIDAVSGATFTSEGFLSAVESALEKQKTDVYEQRTISN